MTTWQNLVLGNQTGGVKRRTRRNAGKRLSQRRSHSKTRLGRSRTRSKTRSTSKQRTRRTRRSKRKRTSRESNNRRNHGFIFSESNDELRNNIFY